MMIATDAREASVTTGGRLAELYERHAPDAARLAYLLTGDRLLAQDLAQEAFVRLIGRFSDLRSPESFPWYLRRTVVNLANSHFRRLRVERSHSERLKSEPQQPVSDVGARAEMREALLALPLKHRTAIALRFYEDLTEAQTAEAMGVPLGTVKSLVSRGLARLREEMGTE